MEMIPVHCPRLPTFDRIVPYLQRIDKARWYSNFGPLVREFESRVAHHFKVEPNQVTTAANGTLMLTALLKAYQVASGSLCVMPSWTFVATAAAARDAGLIPYFVDVDIDTQALDPLLLEGQLAQLQTPIGAVVVVAPFGAPINVSAWDAFAESTGIPVIIDAAAAFDTVANVAEMAVGKSAMMISLHATKVLGIGEAAIALSSDEDLIWRTKSLTGFGFNVEREALIPGSNTKMSEYTAAVGLAALDMWKGMRIEWEMVRDYYMIELDKLNIKAWFSSEWVTSTCNVIIPECADAIAGELKKQNIDTRKWWLNGCHQQRAYLHFPKENLPNTEWLSRSVLGLPLAVDISLENIKRVCASLKNTVGILNLDKAV